MSTYPKINKKEPEMLKIETRDDEIKNLKYQTEKHDHENILKFPQIDNGFYKRKHKNLNKKNIYDCF